MARTIALVACRRMTHEGREYVRGEVFAADPVDASILVRARHAKLIDRAHVPAETDAPRYRRRDLRANA